MRMNFACVYVLHCVAGAYRSQKRATDPLTKLELQEVVDVLKGLEIKPGSSARTASGLNCRIISPASELQTHVRI